MTTSFAPLVIRRKLGRGDWSAPVEFGPDGWRLLRLDGRRSVLVTCAEHDGVEWVHASIAGEELPSYYELKALHDAVFDDGYAYQVFTPRDRHVNIHEHALHLWGRLDGQPALPEFGVGGSI
jgi:hypothetical protein